MKNPECFGVWWEAVPGPAGYNCCPCAIKDKCLAEFATTRLRTAQEEIGCASLTALAEYLEVDEQAVLLAMAHVQKPKRPKQTPVKAEKQETKALAKPIKNKAKKKKRKTKKKARKKGWSWGAQTHEARWNKERERNPLIAQLTPGTQLEATYKDVVYKATVKKGSYDYGELTFPTLSTLTTHIVGNAGRSSVKFWGIERAAGG